MNQVSLVVELEDVETPDKTLKFEILASSQGIEIRPFGFGTLPMANGCGGPIWLELNGTPKLTVWPDINTENCHTIDLAEAAEALRTEEYSELHVCGNCGGVAATGAEHDTEARCDVCGHKIN